MHRDDMDGLTRRGFLRASGVIGAAALLGGANLVRLSDLALAAERNPLQAGEGILVVVTLYGGNDGLNTLVPYADSAYAANRPNLAYTAAEVLHLDASLGLNPGMTGMKAMWDAGRLAIVRGAEYPVPDHSHFRSMDIWQTGSPDAPVNTGWLGRWLDYRNDGALRALSIGSTLPPMLAGRTLSGSSLPVGGLALPADAARVRLGSVALTDDRVPLRARAAQAVVDWFDTADETARALASTPAAIAANSGALGAQLDVVARLIGAAVPTNVYSVSLGGFDTHANEKGAQTSLLTQLSSAVSDFMRRIAGTDRANDVTLLVYSEFGRRVAANDTQGTDHGTSGPMFIAGPRIAGGYYGEQPSLTQLVNGDLAVTTDFRDVYATLLEKALGAPADAVLPGWKGRLVSA